jgi:hypothetical protein
MDNSWKAIKYLVGNRLMIYKNLHSRDLVSNSCLCMLGTTIDPALNVAFSSFEFIIRRLTGNLGNISSNLRKKHCVLTLQASQYTLCSP